MTNARPNQISQAFEEKRRFRRVTVVLEAIAVTKLARQSVRVNDISNGGAGFHSTQPPEKGSEVQFRISGHTLFGDVTWVSENAFGLKFDRELDARDEMTLDNAIRAAEVPKIVAKRDGAS